MALLRALEALRVDLSLEILVDGRHTALTISKVSPKVILLGHAVAHEHLKNLLISLDVVFELSE